LVKLVSGEDIVSLDPIVDGEGLGEGFIKFGNVGGVGQVEGGVGEDLMGIDFRPLAGGGLAEKKGGNRGEKSREE
jgi:hypothetical protein